MTSTRQLAAIMFTDIVGYTALMGENSAKALDLMRASKDIQKPLVEKHHGKWLKEMGDGVLAQFNSALDAVNCACEIQKQARAKLDGKLRIGIHLGDVIFENDDVFGDGVNVASRLESIANPGGIYISESVWKSIQGQTDIQVADLGEISLKNVAYPIRTYSIQGGGLPKPIFKKSKDADQARPGKLIFILAGSIIIVLAWYAYIKIFEQVSKTPNSEIIELVDKSIAVLPFDNESTDPNNLFFANGMVEDIRNNLAQISDLRVISKSSSEKYRETSLTSQEIGRELSINYLIEGTAQKIGNQIKIHAQLISTTNDDHIWQDTYVRDITDIKELFKVQSEIAQIISIQLNAVISPEEKARLETFPTNNLEAHKLYLKGRHFWNNRTKDDLIKSIAYFEQAIAIDSMYALAYAGLADSYLMLSLMRFLPTSEGIPEAKKNVKKALDIDSNLAEAHATLGRIAMVDREWSKAENELLKAIELKPNYATGHLYYSLYLNDFSRQKEARHHINIALNLNPLYPIMHDVSSSLYFNEGEYRKALNELENIAELNEHYSPLIWKRIFNYVMLGEDLKAVEQIKKSGLTDSPLVHSVDQIDDLFAKRGIDSVLRLWVSVEVKKSPWYDYDYKANLYALIGEKELALDMLEKALASNELLLGLNSNAVFDDIRSDPRFIDLLRKMGLTGENK
jgi:class 3 adenylate cyclase/TolB-like protein/lipoprotein NlpI